MAKRILVYEETAMKTPIRITVYLFLPWSHLYPGLSPLWPRMRRQGNRLMFCWLACETEVVWS